jgi:hypothetical protein
MEKNSGGDYKSVAMKKIMSVMTRGFIAKGHIYKPIEKATFRQIICYMAGKYWLSPKQHLKLTIPRSNRIYAKKFKNKY